MGNISGGAFNPAVAIGISILGLSLWSNIWIFLLANFAGGAFAGIVFRVLNPDDCQPLIDASQEESRNPPGRDSQR